MIFGNNRTRANGSLRYLIYLSNKYGIDPYELLNSFIEAEKKYVVNCGSLKIKLRKRVNRYAIFLVTIEANIIAQFRIRSRVFENPIKTKDLYSILITRSKPFSERYF